MTFATDGGIEWEKDTTNKVLTIRPASTPEEGYTSGQMKDYYYNCPWGEITTTGYTLTIEMGVTSIGEYAFYNCHNFSDVKFLGNQPTLGSNAFTLKASSPAKTYDVYSNGWANEETFSEYENTKWNYKTFDNTYVWNGSAWKLGTPYVYTSSGWKQRGGLPCTPAVVGRTDWCRSVI